ncbi:DNA repair protein RecO [Clostridium botulinum]|nr:DNA repair protein RecO [Clostridium botulinum]APC84943.1 DNA repair protein RecO [Clostridium botulinum]APH18459.1 DNA repair protein RecO [Clostridium botulinum]APQ75580.1 DNA repair protein RecO [Clostridium botulinum]EDT81605.1 DNA repair protein RecO [Clostridium botulinum NCTC 2916]
MKNKVVDIEILARAFELKVLKYTGYALNFNHCVECGRKIETSNYISLQSLGGICNYCNKINGIGVTYATYNILKYIYEAPLEKLYRLSVDTETKKDIYKILNTIINQNYLKKPKSLQILNYIKEE